MKTMSIKERPILFSGEMVRAILAGRKTQTRRVIKKLDGVSEEKIGWAGYQGMGYIPVLECGKEVPCPYGIKGDRLWVRETFYQSGYTYKRYPEDDAWSGWAGSYDYFYAADGRPETRGENDWGRAIGPAIKGNPFIPDKGRNHWRKFSSIHMPRQACRFTLEITDVRVERLQEISEADAQAEGADRPILSPTVINGMKVHPMTGHYRDGYRNLWDRINGDGSWEKNPWVWVIGFRRVELSPCTPSPRPL